MTIQSVTAIAAGPTAWLPVNPVISPFSLSMSVTLDQAGSGTYKAQYTYDALGKFTQVASITRSTTTATLTLADHGVSSTADCVIVRGAGAPFDGIYTVAALTSASVFTYTVLNSGLSTAASTAEVCVLRVIDHGTITGKTGNFDGNISVPVTAVRLNVTSYSAGKFTMVTVQGRK